MRPSIYYGGDIHRWTIADTNTQVKLLRSKVSKAPDVYRNVAVIGLVVVL